MPYLILIGLLAAVIAALVVLIIMQSIKAKKQIQWYKAVLDSLAVSVSVKDNNGNWQFLNKAAEALFSVDFKNSIGKPAAFLASNEKTSVESAVLYNAKGNAIGTVDTIQDISKYAKDTSDNLSFAYSVDKSCGQLAYVANQVAAGSQALSHGSTAQASAIQQLSATISDISQQVKMNAANAEKATKISTEAFHEVELGNKQMEHMMKAMDEISSSSSQIGKIIKTIDDIAFQTNILALNAAVEAARAGAAGKGFAVVADEVRNLASKSAEAAKNTTSLIENSIRAVENGTKIAAETAKSLSVIVEETKQSTQLINQISQASNEQAVSISQVTQGVEQISAVVQTNTATAEESAAAAEELNGNVLTLKQLVDSFLSSQNGGSLPNITLPEKKPKSTKLEYTADLDIGGKY